MKQNSRNRILGIYLSSRGFGYAVMEETSRLVDYGHKVFEADKNARSLKHIEKMIRRNVPDVLALQDVNAKDANRAARIKNLHLEVIKLAKESKLKVALISAKEVFAGVLGVATGTKQEMAELLARRFADELSSHLPKKRRPWESQDARMDVFDAVGLVVGTSDRIQ